MVSAEARLFSFHFMTKIDIQKRKKAEEIFNNAEEAKHM